MSPNAQNLLRNVLLVACGAAAGAVAGSFGAAHSPEARRTEERLRERIVELERSVEEVQETAAREMPRTRRRVTAPEGDTRRAADDGGVALPPPDAGEVGAATDDGGRADVSPEFVSAVRSAIDEIRREDARAREIQGLRDERAKYVRDLERRLSTYEELLGLSDEQVEEVRATATAGMDDLLRARARGVEGEELAEMERARQREIRDIVGGANYREMRKLLLDEMARPTIVSVAGQAGVDKEQRDRIERLLDEHIESLVDLDVRARTEDLTAEERATIREKMDAANRAAWDRLRNQILTPEQRERVR